jgi:hypothetical protein
MRDLWKSLVGTSGELMVMAILIAIIVLLNAVFNVAQPLLMLMAVLVFADRAIAKICGTIKSKSVENCLRWQDCKNFEKKA